MAYVDGFILAVPTGNREAYIAVAQLAAQVFKDHGALQVVECWGDEVPDGEVTSFPLAVKLEQGETVVFSWIVWPSKDAQKEGMKKSMEDPRLDPGDMTMPFDAKRMIYGSFETIVDQ